MGPVLLDHVQPNLVRVAVAPDLRGQRRLYVRVEVFDRFERKRGFLPRFSWDFVYRRDWVTLFRVVGCVEFERVRYRRRERVGYFDGYFTRRVRISRSAASVV